VMETTVLRWAVGMATAVLMVATIAFTMTEMLPGDAAFQVAAARYDAERVTPETAREVRRELGLDDAAPWRFARWFAAVAMGEFGRSTVTDQPVWTVMSAPLGRTLLMAGIAWPASLVLGISLGAWLGLSRRGLAVAHGLGALAAGTPSYVVGFMLGAVFAIELGWLPVAGYGHAAHLVLPSATLALLGGLRLSLVTARAVATAQSDPSIAFARMKAVGRFRVLVLHNLPLAAPVMVAYAFLSLAFMLEGAAIVETVFAYPGLGRLLVDAVRARDVPMIQGAAVVIAVGVVTANTAADALATRLNRMVGRS
jgi:peptide/nickel transport system permease protein